MRVEQLKNMKAGWFIGNFEPSLFKTNDCEVAVKTYKKGDKESKHYHKIATEYTVIIKGKVRMFNHIYEEGDATDFEALEDAMNVVVKMPGANNDKYLVEGAELC